MKAIRRIAHEHEGVNARDGESSRSIRGKCHVKRLRKRRRVHHRRDRIDVNWLTVDESKAGRRVHPGIRNDDKDAGEYATQSDHHTGEEMSAWRDARPAVQIDAEKNRLGEKRESLERKRHPDDRARVTHKPRP